MSVNYSAGLSPYVNKGKCGLPEKQDDHLILKEKASKLADLIKSSKVVVVHTGAGLSTSAGIPDFRGPTGVWTLEEKGETPHFDITFEQAVPTFTHRLLVEMEKVGLVHYVISQNVDGLHLRSGFPKDRLAELHGNMFTQKCQLCAKEQVQDHVSPTMGLKLTGQKCEALKCRGRKCRGMLTDTILDWEDALPDDELDMSEKFCKIADLSIVMGSSLQILPAGNLPLLTKKNGGKLVIINLQPTKKDKSADIRIYGYLDDVMQMVAESLNISVPPFKKPTICLRSSHSLPQFPIPTKKRRLTKTRTSNQTDTKSETNNDVTAKSGSKSNSKSDVIAKAVIKSSNGNEPDVNNTTENIFVKQESLDLKFSAPLIANEEIVQKDN